MQYNFRLYRNLLNNWFAYHHFIGDRIFNIVHALKIYARSQCQYKDGNYNLLFHLRNALGIAKVPLLHYLILTRILCFLYFLYLIWHYTASIIWIDLIICQLPDNYHKIRALMLMYYYQFVIFRRSYLKNLHNSPLDLLNIYLTIPSLKWRWSWYSFSE